ncbi:hypothetical protein D9F91_22760 [Escherichia coli]|nr:hypothetical protein [Escherichia coli]EEW1575193.1 hypothetical protein [Escherichia coli]EEW1711605.1 hypothetical protein [Escherichia coli]EEW2029577.1 hypothetical protein [Escherichia coli]EEW2491312.1 hypothetical protein [Escherichia coli]
MNGLRKGLFRQKMRYYYRENTDRLIINIIYSNTVMLYRAHAALFFCETNNHINKKVFTAVCE